MHSHVLPHFSLSSSASKISFLEIIHTGRVYGPIVSFAIGSSSCLEKEVIERQIVPDGVSPSLTSMAKVRKVVKNILVDVR